VKRAGIAVLLLVACHREAPPQASAPRRVVVKTIPSDARNAKVNTLIPVTPPQVLAAARLGATLGADGRVAAETATFRKGQPVYLTLDLHESPVGLATEAVWQDAKGKELARQRREMKGAKTVTFAMKTPLAPGRYKVEGYWGGNVAAEKTFEVK
jgi:methionine-rich copper-binding protein CopC